MVAHTLQHGVALFFGLNDDRGDLAPWIDAYYEIATLDPHTSDILDVDIDEIAPPRMARPPRDAPPEVQGAVGMEDIGGEHVPIRGVPKSGDRLSQLSQPAHIMQEFFGFDEDANEPQSIEIQERSPEGRIGPAEVRPMVLAQANRNRRFEVSALKGISYPEEGVPLAVFTAIGDAEFSYFIRLPGQPGHAELIKHLNEGRDVELDSIQLRRIAKITTRDQVVAAWPGFPE